MEEAYRGKDAKIKIPVNDSCDACDGTGAEKGTSVENCDTCGGVGRVRQQQGFFTIERTCPTCQGRGTLKTPETVCYEIFREIMREERAYSPDTYMVLASQFESFLLPLSVMAALPFSAANDSGATW